MHQFYALSKVEDRDDGTLYVEGVASSEAVDSDGEVIKSDAMSKALPDFFRHGTGALREMHQPIAAGRVDKAEVGADGQTTIAATVVDPVAITKVKAGVYKGFSIGGRVTARDTANKNVITGLRLTEISLVDRPANPESVLTLVKVDDHRGQALGELSKLGGQAMDSATAISALGIIYGLLAHEIGEGDTPTEQIDALTAAVQSIKDFIASEIQEPDTSADGVGGAVELVAPTGDLAKAGARHSAADKKRLQAIHDHAVNMGADCSAPAGKADGADDLIKADLAKVTAERDVATDALTKMTARADDLTKRITELEAIPAASPLEIAARAVSKAQDSASGAAADEPPPATPLEAIRKAHQRPAFLKVG